MSRSGARRSVLITGGSGFVGTNLADRILSSGQPVLLYDNLSRPGVERNCEWLKERHGDLVEITVADVRDARTLESAVEKATAVFHFAAQVAVTTSLSAPVNDFEVNARGTLHVLEAIRAQPAPPPLIFTSTNKVYGDLDHVKLRLANNRYEPVDRTIRSRGVTEDAPLDFHSPYGCSKGAADQYVLDYARTFGIPAAVFRMSCIYGPHQFGTEDQGWVAHFAIQALSGGRITVYGDGKQVRDILFVEDLVEAFLLAQQNIDALSGQAFNIGGGAGNAISLLELIDRIERVPGVEHPRLQFDEPRRGDQRYYVSDTAKFTKATGWKPRTTVEEGVGRLCEWLQEYHAETPALLAAG
jgi:CDP-paratose 2-epimerase